MEIQMKRIFRLSLPVIGILILLSSSTIARIPLCGDVSADGVFNLTDYFWTLEMIYGNGAPLPQHFQGDIDSYVRVTNYDMLRMGSELFYNSNRPFWTFDCNTRFPTLVPPVNPDVRFIYDDTISAGATSATIPVRLSSPIPIDFISLELELSLNGAPVTIDSILPDTNRNSMIWLSESCPWACPPPGRVNFSAFTINRPLLSSGTSVIANIYIRVPSAPVLQLIEAKLSKVRPSGAPSFDTAAIPMVTEFTQTFGTVPEHKPYTPTLISNFMCGDVNHDYVIDSLDAEVMVDYYFNCGSPPTPVEAGDVNCDGRIDFSDVALVSLSAEGGNPPLCCIQDLFPTQSDTTTYPPLTLYQDSILTEILNALSSGQ